MVKCDDGFSGSEKTLVLNLDIMLLAEDKMTVHCSFHLTYGATENAELDIARPSKL